MSKENGLVGFDFETYYDSEYSLTLMSPYSYTHHPKFNAYLVAIDNGEDIKYVGDPCKFDWTLLDGMTLCAHNVSFDLHVLLRLYELGRIPRMPNGARYVCTADMAAYLGVKRDLKTAVRVLLGEEISKSVRSAMKGRAAADLISDPSVLAYGGSDADKTYRLAAKWLSHWPAKEQRISELNREAAIRGFTLDLGLVNRGIAALAPQLQAAEDRIPWVWVTDASGNRVQDGDGQFMRTGDKPLSPNALKTYGNSLGLAVPASVAKDNPDFLEWVEVNGDKVPWIGAIGKYRSVNTLLKRVCALRDGYNGTTGRFVYEKKYYGASTGRFSGGSATDSGGKFNMENMPRKAMYGVDVRPMFKARPGHKLIISDYNQVEARYLLWIVGDTEALKPCFAGKSVYQAYAELTGTCSPDVDLKSTNDTMYKFTKACLSGDTLVLTNRGYIPIVHVTDTDLVWDGLSWVNQKGPVCNGIREWDTLVNYHGESYTDDHPVFTGPSSGDTVPIGTLCERGEICKLAWRQTPGSAWADVWTLARAVGRSVLLLGKPLCKVLLHRLRNCVRSKCVQPHQGKDNPVQSVRDCKGPAQQDT